MAFISGTPPATPTTRRQASSLTRSIPITLFISGARTQKEKNGTSPERALSTALFQPSYSCFLFTELRAVSNRSPAAGSISITSTLFRQPSVIPASHAVPSQRVLHSMNAQLKHLKDLPGTASRSRCEWLLRLLAVPQSAMWRRADCQGLDGSSQSNRVRNWALP